MNERHEKILSKRFELLIETTENLEDLLAVEEFIKTYCDKVPLKSIAYSRLFNLLGSEDSTNIEIAFAYFITGLTYKKPEWRYLYFSNAGDYFRDAGMSELFVSSLRQKEFAAFKIELDGALNFDENQFTQEDNHNE